MVKIECFFDCASPWAYLGFTNLLALTTRLGIEVTWRPVVVGFVFAEVNQEIYLNRRLLSPQLKGAYENRELRAWAERHRHGLADTAGFLALCEELAKRELDDFFARWLFSELQPEVPAWERRPKESDGTQEAGGAGDSGG